MLTGKNGVLNRANEAKYTNEVAQFEEKVKLAQISLQAEITAKTKSQPGYIATEENNFASLAGEVANDLDVTAIKAPATEETKINKEGYTVGHYLDTPGNSTTDGKGFIAIWYTSNSFRATLDRDEIISKNGIIDIAEGSNSRNQAALVAVITVENYSCTLSNTALTSTTDGDSDITKTKASQTTLNSLVSSGEETGSWTYDHSSQTVTNGSLTLNIGDKVYQTAYTVDGKTFDGKWRVLGEEGGQLLLVSENYVDFTSSTSSSGVPTITLQGSNGIDNEAARLNTLGAKFADGTKTEKGRSIKVEDINKITNYNPTESRLNPNDLTQTGPWYNGQSSQYGNNVTYTMKSDGNVWYKGDKAVTTETSSIYTKFWLPGTSTNITEPFPIQSTAYDYFPETLGNFPGSSVATGQTMEGISTTSPAYDMLFKPQSNIPYWLASPFVLVGPGNVRWNLFIVAPPGLVASTGYALWYSNNGSNSRTYGVRSAVSLKSDIQPTLKSTDTTTGISTYEI